jgi:hypothetical protein
VGEGGGGGRMVFFGCLNKECENIGEINSLKKKEKEDTKTQRLK